MSKNFWVLFEVLSLISWRFSKILLSFHAKFPILPTTSKKLLICRRSTFLNGLFTDKILMHRYFLYQWTRSMKNVKSENDPEYVYNLSPFIWACKHILKWFPLSSPQKLRFHRRKFLQNVLVTRTRPTLTNIFVKLFKYDLSLQLNRLWLNYNFLKIKLVNYLICLICQLFKAIKKLIFLLFIPFWDCWCRVSQPFVPALI